MTEKRFEFREINELPILPKCYDTEKQEYANLFECVGWLNELYRENEQLKTQLKDCEKRVTDKEVEWLRENTVWEQMPSSKRTFTIITKE